MIIALVIAGIGAVYSLGELPGRIARPRGHAQAAATSVCGWLGLITFVLWPFALVWAYTSPRGDQAAATSQDFDELLADLRRISARVAAIEAGLGSTSPRRIA